MSTPDLLVLIGLLLVVLCVLVVFVSLIRYLVQRIREFFAPRRSTYAMESSEDALLLPSLKERRARWSTLTRQQKIACRHAARGLTDGEIAEVMGIGIRTVETHVADGRTKLGLESRYELKHYLQGIVD